jgi:hypothetical protein
MKPLLIVASLLASPLAAQEGSFATIGRLQSYSGTSSVTIQATDQYGAVAEVIFHNLLNNNDDDVGPTLTYDGVSVDIIFSFNVGGSPDDSITVIPPFGYYASPETIQVQEYTTGIIYIYPELTS